MESRFVSRVKLQACKIRRHIRDYPYNKECRKRLDNKGFSIISHNCMAGILYHRYGMEFLSPTINLWLEGNDFYYLCKNLKEYLTNGKLYFVKSEYNYPVAILKCSECKDIRIYFLHYANEEEAAECWYKRCKRVNYDNLYIIGSDFGMSESAIRDFGNIASNGTVIFTNKIYKDLSYTFYLEKYKNNENVGKYVNDINPQNGIRYVESVFDFCAFFNSKL